jgi:hypothetical protein
MMMRTSSPTHRIQTAPTIVFVPVFMILSGRNTTSLSGWRVSPGPAKQEHAPNDEQAQQNQPTVKPE